MTPRPPGSTLPDTLFPDPSLFRSHRAYCLHRLDAAGRGGLFAADRVRGFHRADHGAAVGALAAGFRLRRRLAGLADLAAFVGGDDLVAVAGDRKSTRLNSSH